MVESLELARRLFMMSRRTGNTECAIDACRIHEEAYLIVHHASEVKRIVAEYPELVGRVIPLSEADRLRGTHAPLVWDTTAVAFLVETIYNDLNRQFLEVTGFHAV